MIRVKSYTILIALSLLIFPVEEGSAQELIRSDTDQDIEEVSKKSLSKGAKSLSAVATASSNPLLDNYDVKFYKLDIVADTLYDDIGGTVTILVEVVNNPLATLVLELSAILNVSEVTIDGLPFAFSHSNDEINIPLANQVAVGELITVQVSYGGQTGPGMFVRKDNNWHIAVTATLSEPFYAKDWFPCKQDLTDKADSVHVFITTDYGLMGVSNGLLTGTSYLPNGKVRYEWKSNYPIDFYLISIAVSDYIEYNIEAKPEGMDPILIQNFVYDIPGCLEFYQEKIDATIGIMELYCDLFGPYPFRDEKYGHYLWPRGGGMEHQTMTGMSNFEFYLISHELGHSWFGNYVTCATWRDIWINEGFATYSTYLAKEFLVPEIAAAEKDGRFEAAMRDPEGTVYVPLEDIDDDSRIFNSSLSYSKGSTLLHMIRFVMDDDELFFQSFKDYLEIYGDSVATGLDYKESLENSTGVDFTDFFDQWYFGAGYPIFDVSWGQIGQTVTINSNQTTSSAKTPLFKTPMEYRLTYDGGDTLVRVDHEVNNEVYTFEINHTITGLDVDPFNHVVDYVESVKHVVGIEEHMQLFSLYPNPSEGVFKFISGEGTSGQVGLEVYNSLNQLVYHELIDGVSPSSSHTIDIGSQTEGFYFVQFRYGDKLETQKIIIK